MAEPSPHQTHLPEADVAPVPRPSKTRLESRQINDLIEVMRVSLDKLAADQTSRGDMKILSRAIRELRYAFKVFTPYRRQRKVTVFGSARLKPDHPAYVHSVEFGRLLHAFRVDHPDASVVAANDQMTPVAGPYHAPRRGNQSSETDQATNARLPEAHGAILANGGDNNGGFGGGDIDAVHFRQSSNGTLKTVTVKSVKGNGVNFSATSSPTLNNVHVEDTGGVAFFSEISANPIFTAVSASGAGVKAIQWRGGTHTVDRTFNITSLPYIFSGSNDVLAIGRGTTLRLDPGVVLKLGNDQYLIVSAGGNLIAPGTESDPRASRPEGTSRDSA